MKTTPKYYMNLRVNNVDTAIIKRMMQGRDSIDIDFRLNEYYLWKDEDRSINEIMVDLEGRGFYVKPLYHFDENYNPIECGIHVSWSGKQCK